MNLAQWRLEFGEILLSELYSDSLVMVYSIYFLFLVNVKDRVRAVFENRSQYREEQALIHKWVYCGAGNLHL